MEEKLRRWQNLVFQRWSRRNCLKKAFLKVA